MADFLQNLLTVAEQVFILFLLVGLGFICGKAKLLGDESVKILSNLALMFATPAVIIKSFMRTFDSSEALNYLYALIGAFLCHIIAIAVAHGVFRKKTKERLAVFRGSIVFSNAGFMGLPLQAALLGTVGTFYGSAYATMLTLFLWTYGVSVMSFGQEKMNLKKIILNPGIISVIIGVPIFIFSLEMPDIIKDSVTHIANLNTPLPMLVIGYYLSKTSFKNIFSKNSGMLANLIKLILVPLLCLGILRIFGFSGELLISTIISISAPVAVGVTMFTAKYGGETELSANMVSISTLLSIITMPIIVALTQTIA